MLNDGAWLTVDGRRVDVHYRDLDDVEHHLGQARAGRFQVERLLFHLAGIPTYIVVAELAVRRLLYGEGGQAIRIVMPPGARRSAAVTGVTSSPGEPRRAWRRGRACCPSPSPS